MSEFALWRRLDTPCHDAALLSRGDAGYALQGTAIFKHPAGPACVHYSVDIDASWRTRHGRGFLAGRALDHVIGRDAEIGYLDGALMPGLDHLWDLDYGFTPTTNLQQLRKVALAPGESIDLPVAWLDLDAATLSELSQRYERRDETTYHYTAPSVPYEGLLQLSRNGFVRRRPLLLEMEL